MKETQRLSEGKGPLETLNYVSEPVILSVVARHERDLRPRFVPISTFALLKVTR
jgi:hypothetical protein